MKHLLKLAYKLGQLSYKCPKPSTKPFKAMYKEAGNEYILQERSRFLQQEKDSKLCWFYIEGEYPEPAPIEQSASPVPVKSAKTLGRNDPCLCGSGKKYKKCCLNK